MLIYAHVYVIVLLIYIFMSCALNFKESVKNETGTIDHIIGHHCHRRRRH